MKKEKPWELMRIQLLFGHVGRFSKQKNQSFLIDIFNEYQKNNKSILVLVGTGELEQEIRRKIEEYKLMDRVKMLGNQMDVFKWYSAFDILLFPSLYEGLSLVLIEAQCNGLKVVTSSTIDRKTDITGNLSFVELNESPVKWAEVVEKTDMKRYDVCEKISKSGYNVKEISKKMMDIYLSCL